MFCTKVREQEQHGGFHELTWNLQASIMTQLKNTGSIQLKQWLNHIQFMINKTWVYLFTSELQPIAKQVDTLTKNRPFFLNITASRPGKLTHLLRTMALTPFLPSIQSCCFKILTTGIIALISSDYFESLLLPQ